MHNGLTPFQRGIDFICRYRGRAFTLKDLSIRYEISYKQAARLKLQAERLVPIRPAGFRGQAILWRVGKCR